MECCWEDGIVASRIHNQPRSNPSGGDFYNELHSVRYGKHPLRQMCLKSNRGPRPAVSAGLGANDLRTCWKVIPIGKSVPVSILRGEPPDLSSILVSPSEALFERRFVLCPVPLESQAGRDLV